MNLRIDPALKTYLPPPNPARVVELERLLLKYGCRDPIVVRNGFIVDGHHRYAICTKHGIPYKVEQLDPSIDTDEKIRIYMLEHAIFGQGTRQFDAHTEREQQLRLCELHVDAGTSPGEATQRVADKYGVSKRTVYRNVKASKAVAEVKREVAEAAGGRETIGSMNVASIEKFTNLSTAEQLDIIERNGGDPKRMEKELGKRKPQQEAKVKPIVGEPEPKAVKPTKADKERAAKRPAAQAIREALDCLAQANKAMYVAKDAVVPSRFASWRQKMIDLDADWSAFIEEQLEREGVNASAPF